MARRQSRDTSPGGEIFYKEFTDEVIDNDGREIKTSEDCNRERSGIKDGFFSAVSIVTAVTLSFLYTAFVMRPKVVNRSVLKQFKDTGYFLYGNHTHPEGDVFCPIRCVFPKHLCALIAPANLNVPVLGKLLLPYGCLVVPDSPAGMKEFTKGIADRVRKKRCILVYPEAHVWPWCTFIRPFSEAPFHYPVDLDVPSFCMTTTYRKPRHGKKPRAVVYIDGPFFPQRDKGRKEAIRLLHDEIFSCMRKRSRKSDYEYVTYTRNS